MDTQTQPSDITQSDVAVRPTIFVVMDEHGDVTFASNNNNIDLPMAIAMIDLAKQKMMAQYFMIVATEKKKAEQRRPSILLPTPNR